MSVEEIVRRAQVYQQDGASVIDLVVFARDFFPTLQSLYRR